MKHTDVSPWMVTGLLLTSCGDVSLRLSSSKCPDPGTPNPPLIQTLKYDFNTVSLTYAPGTLSLECGHSVLAETHLIRISQEPCPEIDQSVASDYDLETKQTSMSLDVTSVPLDLDTYIHVTALDSGLCTSQRIPISCEADANQDGNVDPLDSGYVMSRMNCAVGVGNADCDAADVNADGLVDGLDFGYVLARLGQCRY